MISVILPVFNSEKTISKCIDSILNQSFSNFELLIIDDGSTDSTENIIKSYKDNRITYIRQLHSDVSCARNAGIDKASGDYLLFIDSDDEIENNLFEEFDNYLNQYDLDIICSNIKSTFDNNISYNIQTDSFVIDSNDKLLEHYNEICPYMAVSKLYRKTFIKDNNLYFKEDINTAEDFIFVLECIQNTSNIGKIEKSSYIVHNVNPYSLSKIYDPNIEDSIRILDDIFNKVNLKYPGLDFVYAVNDMDFKVHEIKMYADNIFKKESRVRYIESIKLVNNFLINHKELLTNNYSIFCLKSKKRIIESIIIKTNCSLIISSFYYLKHKLFKRHYL